MCIDKQVTADEIKTAVNAKLRYYPWSGECINVHKNEWDEWIADCHIWGPYRSQRRNGSFFYSAGDTDCPITQKMITVDSDPYRFDLGYPSINMWDAKDDKRLPTFIEEGGTLLDPSAPPSPYIVNSLKKYLRNNNNDILF